MSDLETQGPLLQMQWFAEDDYPRVHYAQAPAGLYYRLLGHDLYTAKYMSGQLSERIKPLIELPYHL